MKVSSPTRKPGLALGLSLLLVAVLFTACVAPAQAPAAQAPAAAAAPASDDPFIKEAIEIAKAASAPVTKWDGPTTGPKAQADKLVVSVASDLNNGGVLGVNKGAEEAAAAIGWKFQTIDGKGTLAGQTAALEQALALKPDGIIVNGIDAASVKDVLKKASDMGIKLVGWHAGPKVGPMPELNLATNITSDPIATSKVAAKYVIAQTNGKANVVIFTDSTYEIAVRKARAMEEEIKNCKTCKVLEFVDTPLAETSTRMGPLVTNLKQKYGDDLNWMMGINDLYFDFASPGLKSIGVPPSGPPLSISAGDGSESAYARIRDGQYQAATIPEPLNLHGWMTIDELNRAMAGEKDSGYVLQIHLVTKDNIGADGGPKNVFDPDNGYRDQYKKIWGK
ncbi:MAG: substrate-binding domain-containing protein [Caldilineaceae bacterium]